MNRLPISELEIWDKINAATLDMSAVEQRLWEIVSILPKKWKHKSYGSYGAEAGGFWVVGIIGKNVIWYDEAEGEFNFSRYVTYGEIAEYGWGQHTLLAMVKSLNRMIIGDL